MSSTDTPPSPAADARALLARLEGPYADRSHPARACRALCTPWCHGA
ncbi:hypothetical protein [Motilibacter deserti]|uniref:Uncharacterized protein n=1 Tax=Motilibacter deserti TaxID=2714956 RepID=A0ABX0GRU8_9ACTN|nr:hypothetical protein [Motilibacter deserti]NHC13603.1 hypothetical protein [Motilibacter deserti]